MAINVKFTADSQKVMNEFAKLEAKVIGLEGKLKKVGTTGDQTKKKMSGAFDTGPVKGMVAMLTGTGGLLLALRAITKEYAAHKEIQAEMAKSQVTLASARKDIIRNMAGAKPETITSIFKSAETISRKQGVVERFVTSAFAEALSASGGDVAASRSAVRMATKYLADKPEQIPALAGSLLDLSKVSGTKDARINLGLMQEVAARSRVTSAEQQARNIPRSLIGQMAYGATPAGAAALFESMTVGSADFTGSVSATASISLARQLEQAALGKKTFGTLDPSMRPTGTTMAERLASLQENPALAEAFLSKASFEQVVSGPIRRLVSDRDSAIGRSFTKNMGSFPDMASLGSRADQAIANFGLDPLETTARLQRAIDAANEGMKTVRTREAMVSVGRVGVQELLETSGLTGWGAKLNTLGFDTSAGLDTPDVLEQIGDAIRNRAIGIEMRGGQRRMNREITEAERQIEKQETEEARLLREVLAQVREQTVIAREAMQRQGGGAAMGSPAEDR